MLAWFLGGCSGLRVPQEEAERAPATGATEAQDSLSGWFHVIWGDRAHYVLVMGSGESVELTLEPSVLDSIRDPLLLDRRRVTVLGVRTSVPGATMRVFTIRSSAPGS